MGVRRQNIWRNWCPGAMIPLPPLTRIFLAGGATDMRKGFDGLAVVVQQALRQSPHFGALFAFRGKRRSGQAALA